MNTTNNTTENTGQGWFGRLFEELKRRRVIRAATLYAVIFWPIIQIVDILSPALGLPDSVMRILFMTFAAGLPVVLIAAWLFELNQQGLVRDVGGTVSGDPDSDNQAMIGSRAELGIIAVMLVVVAALFYAQWQLDLTAPAPTVAGASQVVPTTVSGEVLTGRSIAVLPFESFSDDTRDRFFADGLSEELLNVLTRVNGLQVAARTSSFAYRDVKKTVQQIGQELLVDVVLEGSVRRNDTDGAIRVTAQLIDTATGAHLWSQTYDRQYTDVFKIQDEISKAVVSELKITLLGDEAQEMMSHASASPEAMITYSMGQAELSRRTEVAMADAVRLFRRALELDPNYVAAWVGLADGYTLQASYMFGDSDELLVESQKAVDRALALDPQSGLAWASQGLIHSMQKDKDLAREAFVKAIALSPSYAMAHMWYAGLLEDSAAALVEYEAAYRLDPRSPVAGYNVASKYIAHGREAEAMRVFSAIVEADPNYPMAYDLAARVSRGRGRLSDAIRQYEKSYEIEASPKVAYELASLQLSMGNFGESDEWVALGKPQAHEMEQMMYTWLDIQRHVMMDDLEGARIILRALSHSTRTDDYSVSVAPYAAYLSGDYALAISKWDEIKVKALSSNDHQDDALEYVMLGVAFAYRQQDDYEAADELIKRVGLKLANRVSGTNPVDASVWYRYALFHALEGKSQMALMNLQRAIDEGWVDHWQPQVEPALQGLLPQSDMQNMLAGLQTRLNLSREQYAFDKSFAATASAELPGS